MCSSRENDNVQCTLSRFISQQIRRLKQILKPSRSRLDRISDLRYWPALTRSKCTWNNATGKISGQQSSRFAIG